MKKIPILLFFLFLSLDFYAKDITFIVIDKDIKIPLEGVKITVKNENITVYTDAAGTAKTKIKDETSKLTIEAGLIGYDRLVRNITDLSNNTITLYMSIGGVLEGKEFVIEKEKQDKSDEEVAVSKVIDSNELKSTSEIGIIEDALSSIKFMPGVTFSGGFDKRLSVRGGYPGDLTIVYDGFVVRYPYHWGASYSIFNPNAIDSIKFSYGIFNAKNGLSISGLVEFQSITPDKGFKFETVLSTSSLDTFWQIPMGKKAGLFIGNRITYYDPIFIIYDNIKKSYPSSDDGTRFPTSPYIRDAYLKWFVKPIDRLEIYVNGMFAGDGIGTFYDQALDYRNTSDITTLWNFTYYNYYAFGTFGIKALPADNIFLHFFAGYEFLSEGLDARSSETGTKEYSSAFKDYYLETFGIPLASDEFEIRNLKSHFYQDSLLNNVQSRFDADFQLNKTATLSAGAGMFFDNISNSQYGNFYSIDYENGLPVYKKQEYTLGKDEVKEKQILKSYIYINLLLNVIPEVFKIELGCRLDHAVYFKTDLDGGRLNTIPVPGPRLLLTYTPVRNLDYLKSITISAGIGLFSKIPELESMMSSRYGLKDFSVPVPKTLSVIAGFEAAFPFGLKFKIEGYYKFNFNRLYFIYYGAEDMDDSRVHLYGDGIGHVAGFDLIFERRFSKFIDGWISYSFIYSRYKNPESEGQEGDTTAFGDPSGREYYPSFHRFHNLNVVLNVKPLNWLTLTALFSFASGTPKQKYGGKQIFGAILEDGTVVEMYTRQKKYDDDLRNSYALRLDLKMTFHFYMPRSRINFESYIAVEDFLKFVYKPNDAIQTDRYTGKEQPAASENFNFPIPIPSVGIKLNF